MKNSKKKSPAKSKKKSKKNPLRKYQLAGAPVVTPTPALGSSSFAPSTGIQIGAGAYGGSNAMTTNPYSNPNGLNGGFQIGGNMGTGNATSLPNPNTLSLGNAYGGNDLSLDRTATSTPGNSGMFDTKVEGLNEMKSLDLAPKPAPINKTNQALDGIGAAMPGVGLVTNLVKDSSIKDPSGYYDKKTKASLEKYNRKINAASAASSVGQGMLATASAWGPLAWIPAAVGGITVGASEGAKASYRAKQGNLGEDYDTRVADRVKYKESQAQRRQENLDRNAATNYYDQGSGLASSKYGGMREYQAGGLNQEVPLEEEMNVMDPAMNVLRNGGIRKYMGGGYQKVNGPSHENGGIAMDLSGDGINDSELEGGEIIEEMKHGGNAPKKYIWSDHLKTGGMSFAKKFEKLRKGGARPGDVETLRIEQEIAAKRDPSKLYAKYGGIMKYQQGGQRPDPSYGDLMKGDTRKYTESQTSNAVNSLYNRRKPVETKRAFEDHSESEQQLIELVSGSSTKPKYTPYVPQYQNLQNQSYRRNGVDVTQINPNYATSNMSGTINYTDATGKKITRNNPYANFEGSMGNPAQLYNDPFADKNLHPVPKSVEFTRRDSLLGMRDRNLPLSAEEIESLGAEADRNYKVPVNIPPSWGPVSANKLRHEEGKLPRFRKNGGMMEYKKGGVSRTDTGRFLAEYGAPMASMAGAAGDIAMNLSQKYNPVETVNARELTADKIYIDRAKDKQAGFRESELRGAKRASRAITGRGATQRENALRMTSLRAGEMAAQNIYEQNRQASTDEQKINLEAQMRVDEANRQTDLVESESRRGEGLRKESFENMRKKYIGSVAGQLGNELASGMYRKEYINATLPDGVNQYALKPKAISNQMKKINPETKKKYTYAEATNAVLMQYNLENP